MNIKRTYFQGLLASIAVGLLLANCTIKESDGGDDDGCTKGKKHNGCDCSGGLVGYQVCGSDGTYGECVCGKGGGDDKCAEGDKASGCSCAGNTVGYQVCDDEGVYGSCVCPDGGGTSGSGSGGTSGTSGSANGGSSGSGTAAASSGGASGAGGDGGAPSIPDLDPEDCVSCLQVLCADEWQACLDDKEPDGVSEPCISEDGQSGQYVDIENCINQERINGLVKRDVVRNCGVTIGASATNASFNDAWQPQGMRDSTTNLINCMATSSSEKPNADWANSDDNFPVDSNNNVNPTPWPADSCAKLSCTSQFQ